MPSGQVAQPLPLRSLDETGPRPTAKPLAYYACQDRDYPNGQLGESESVGKPPLSGPHSTNSRSVTRNNPASRYSGNPAARRSSKKAFLSSGSWFALDANASCMIDVPEIGDIGPSSELVCRELERRFPGSILAVEGRNIHSPQAVSVHVSVNSESVTLRYGLDGLAWHPVEGRTGDADKDMFADGLSMRLVPGR